MERKISKKILILFTWTKLINQSPTNECYCCATSLQPVYNIFVYLWMYLCLQCFNVNVNI